MDATELADADDGSLPPAALRSLLRACRPHVKRLRVPRVNAGALAVAAAYSPMLEEIHAFSSPWPAEALLEFVHSCTRLRVAVVALALNVSCDSPDFQAGAEALRLPPVCASRLLVHSRALEGPQHGDAGPLRRSVRRETLPLLLQAFAAAKVRDLQVSVSVLEGELAKAVALLLRPDGGLRVARFAVGCLGIWGALAEARALA